MNITGLSIGPESGRVLAFDDDVKQLVELDPVVVDWINEILSMARAIKAHVVTTVSFPPMIYDVLYDRDIPATQEDIDRLTNISLAYAKLNGRIEQAREEGRKLLSGESSEVHAQF